MEDCFWSYFEKNRIINGKKLYNVKNIVSASGARLVQSFLYFANFSPTFIMIGFLKRLALWFTVIMIERRK